MVAPLPIQDEILTNNQSLDDSQSGELSEVPASPPVGRPGALTRKLLKGKIQTRVQDRVSDFWKERLEAT